MDLTAYEPIAIQTALPARLRGDHDPFRKVARVAVPLPVIQHNHITDERDNFQCGSYSMKLSAGMCIKRQREANHLMRTKDKWLSGRGNLDTAKCRSCPTGQRTADYVRRGPRRAPPADRKGSVILPDRTRAALALMFADRSVAAVAREVGLSWGTVARAAKVGTMRKESFEVLRAVFPMPADLPMSGVAA